MRVILPVALCFMWMGLAWAQAPQSGAPPAANIPPTTNGPAATSIPATALTCKTICESGESGSLSSGADKALYFTCFMQNFCKDACKDRYCGPIANEQPPPAGSPLDIIRRMIDEGRV
jgi:hypothetical protein